MGESDAPEVEVSNDPDLPERKRLGAALRILRDRIPLSQAAAGARIGTTGPGWAKYEQGLAPSIFQPSVQDRLARAVESTREELAMRAAALNAGGGRGVTSIAEATRWQAPRGSDDRIPIVGRLQAGNWAALDDLAETTARPSDLLRSAKYGRAGQWLRPHFGESMNLAGLLDGDLVQVVATADFTYWPMDDHLVEVERRRMTEDGVVRERQVRAVQVTHDGVLLWARSSNPKWAEPLACAQGEPAADGLARIVGLVLATHRNLT